MALKIVINSGACQVTPGSAMPSLDYVKKVAMDKFGIAFPNYYPLFLVDLYTLFNHHNDCIEKGVEYNPEDLIIPRKAFKEACIKMNHDFESVSDYYGLVTKSLRSIDPSVIPGNTQLQKALQVMLFVVNAPSNRYDKDIIDEYSKLVSDLTVVEGFKNLRNYDTKAKYDSNLSAESIGPEIQAISLDIGESIRETVHSITPSMGVVMTSNPEKSIPINRAVILMLKCKMQVQSYLGLKEGSITDYKVSNLGKERRKEQMSKFSQLNKANMVSRSLPTFKQKVFKKELLVTEKVKPTKSKQGIVILEDNSGSMDTLWKQSYIRGIMLHFLDEVVKGNAELEHSHYLTDIYNTTAATTPEEAKAMFDRIKKNRPPGGGTDIGGVLQHKIDELSARTDLVNKEIFILLDGQDPVNPDLVNPKDVKINAVCLGVNNQGVHDVCKKSNGKFVCVVLPGGNGSEY